MPYPDRRIAMTGAGARSFLGRAADSNADPWYRFDRVIGLLGKHVAVRPGARWLDLGCQLGQFIRTVQSRHDIAAVGIDNFEAGEVAHVAKRYFDLEADAASRVFDASWRYHCRSIEKTGLALVESFDVISCLEILEHMVDTDAFLEDCRAHLVDRGCMVISTPNINSLRNRVQVPFGAYPAGLEYRNVIHHVRLYNARTLRDHVESKGFRLLGMAGVSFLPARLLRFGVLRSIDAWLADRFPSLCGNLIAVFEAV